MHLIVGIDTGKTMAYACLGLDGRIVGIGHKASCGTDWIVDQINSIGTPSIIACDKEPNETIRKIGAAFNARIFYPNRQLSSLDKRLIAKPLGITNPHERDACAAAVKAYNTHINKLKQAEHIAKAKSIKDADLIMAKVMERYSIEEAIAGKKANRL
jgi:hypothetical protein